MAECEPSERQEQHADAPTGRAKATPADPHAGELADEQLEEAAGGAAMGDGSVRFGDGSVKY